MKNAIHPIGQMREGQEVTGFYVVRKKQLKTKRDGAFYLHLELGDASGRITANIWDDASSLDERIKTGSIVKVRGRVNSYHNTLQLSIAKVRPASEQDAVDASRFLPKTECDLNSLKRSMQEMLDSVENRWLRKLLDSFFRDADWLKRFQEAPGGKLWHHACLGGLFEHTMTVVKACHMLLKNYEALDRDLTITAAFLHDIGKMKEYRYDQGFIEYSDEGRLIGHISIGAQQVRDQIRSIDGFPEALEMKLVHLLLSHQGELEHGSPVVPLVPEGMVLYYADEMDSKVNALQHIQKRDREPGRHWSQWVPVLERFIYLGEHDH